MKTKTFALVTLCLLFSISAQAGKIKGNGNVITKEVNVSDYESIEVGGNISNENWGFGSGSSDTQKFHYTQKAGKSGLTITIDENLFPLLEISSSNKRLVIKSKDRDKICPTRFIIKGSSEELKNLSISGALDFILESPLKSDELKVSLSGAGDIIFDKRVEIGLLKTSISGAGDMKATNLTCDQLESSISGAGDLELKGKADKAKFSVSGKSDIDAYGFEVKDISASVSGVGDINVYATEKLDASVSGVGDISYKGNPTVNARKSGMGSITKK